MFLTKAKHGVWYLYFDGTDGRTKSISTKCRLKSDALKFLQSFKADQKRIPKSPLISYFIEEFLSYAKINYRPGTQWIYKNVLNRLQSLIGDLPVAKITPRHWDAYKTNRLSTVNAVRTNIELRALRAAMNTAVRWDIIPKNPFNGLSLCHVPERAPVYFTKDDFQKLIDMIKEPWLKEVVIFATLTGLRRGEIVNLRWSDINFERNTVLIQNSPTFKTKAGRKNVFPLSDAALFILKQKQRNIVSEFVFTLNEKQIYAGWLSAKFKYYVYACNFKDDSLHFHSLRHTFASWLVQDGVSLFEVQKLLGHTDSKTTMVYSHLQPEQLHKTVNRINLSLN